MWTRDNEPQRRSYTSSTKYRSRCIPVYPMAAPIRYRDSNGWLCPRLKLPRLPHRRNETHRWIGISAGPRGNLQGKELREATLEAAKLAAEMLTVADTRAFQRSWEL